MKLVAAAAALWLGAMAVNAQESFLQLLESGSAQRVLEAVQSGADARHSDRSGVTPLMIAAAKNPDPGVALVLLAAGARTTERDWVDMTPLMYAARSNPCPRVVQALLQ